MGTNFRMVYHNIMRLTAGSHSTTNRGSFQPFLVDELKFDLRIYVLVTSCDPLRIYVYKDGLVRFAVNPYQDPTNNNVVCYRAKTSYFSTAFPGGAAFLS